jgi:hypothetical protein
MTPIVDGISSLQALSFRNSYACRLSSEYLVQIPLMQKSSIINHGYTSVQKLSKIKTPSETGSPPRTPTPLKM